MNSAIYEGWVRHRRFSPRPHAFTYRMLMLLLDLDEIGALAANLRLFGTQKWAPVQFRRSSYWGDPARPLKNTILDLVESRTGERPGGAVRLLTQPRFWGIGFNPISVYYCFGADGKALEATVAEVTNTPWGEKHCYVLPASSERGALSSNFAKKMHVSPFMPMTQRYRWRGRRPSETLAVHLESFEQGRKKLDATLSLKRKTLTSIALASCLARHPLSTAKVVVAIHWQALRLLVKGVPVHPHPSSQPQTGSTTYPDRAESSEAAPTTSATTNISRRSRRTRNNTISSNLETPS